MTTTPPAPPRSRAVDPEGVIQRLGSQIAHLATELAMKDTALEEAYARIADLERAAEPEADQP